MTILCLPLVTAFVGWAVASWVVTGEPFPQFTSKYGNSRLLAQSHETVGTISSRLVHEAEAMTYMAPLLAVIVSFALIVALLRRNQQVLGILAILGGGLAFTLASYLMDAVFPWFRYYIVAVPFEVLLVGSLFSTPIRRARTVKPYPEPPLRFRFSKPDGGKANSALASLAVVLLSVVLLMPSTVGTALAMTNDSIAPDVVKYTSFIFQKTLTPPQRAQKDSYAQVQQMSSYLSDQHFGTGDVVADTANSCIPNVYTNVTDPRAFVITNDRDFQQVLADPLASHSHYLLVGSAQYGDAILARYPNLGEGTRWVHLVHTFRFPLGGYCNGFRLFRVLGHPPDSY